MKKTILLVLATVFLAGYITAQSLSTSGVVNNIYGLSTDPLIQANFNVINNNVNTLNVLLRRYEISMATSGGDTATDNFCWGPTCYGTGTSLSPTAAAIASGAINNSFYGDYQPNGAVGTSIVRYTFFDMNNANDSIQVELNYITTAPAGINNIANTNFISVPSPNPASSLTAINYSLNENSKGKVKVYDILGNTVKEFNVSAKHGTIILPVSDMRSGIYFMSLMVDDKNVSNKKLIVSHK